jgi:hypothetical protein
MAGIDILHVPYRGLVAGGYADLSRGKWEFGNGQSLTGRPRCGRDHRYDAGRGTSRYIAKNKNCKK